MKVCGVFLETGEEFDFTIEFFFFFYRTRGKPDGGRL